MKKHYFALCFLLNKHWKMRTVCIAKATLILCRMLPTKRLPNFSKVAFARYIMKLPINHHKDLSMSVFGGLSVCIPSVRQLQSNTREQTRFLSVSKKE